MNPMDRWLAIFGLTAFALLAANVGAEIEAAKIEVGALNIEPRLRAEWRHEDNLFRQRDDELASWVQEISPRVTAWFDNGYSQYGVAYELTDYKYSDSEDDDFVDHQLELDLHHEFNVRNTLDIDGRYYDGHEFRGQGLTEGNAYLLVDSPIEYTLGEIGGQYTLGTPYSTGRLELQYQRQSYQYQNYRDLTRLRDRNMHHYRLGFFYRVAPRTALSMEVRRELADYDRDRSDGDSLDSEEWSYLLGVEWNVSGKLDGYAKVGAYERRFDSGNRDDSDGARWEVDVVWHPKTYSHIRFGTRQYSQETNGLGDYVQSEEYTLSWEHQWSARNRTRIRYLSADDQYVGVGGREDRRGDLSFSVHRQVARWIDVGLGWRNEHRSSEVRALNYRDRIFFVDLQLSL